MLISLEGLWQADIGDGKLYPMHLPGTLDENKIGYRDRGGGQCHPGEGLGEPAQEKEAEKEEAGEKEAEEKGAGKEPPIATRLTRKYTYEGPARFTRRFHFDASHPLRRQAAGKRVFLEAERARCLKLLVNGREVPEFEASSLSTPHVFEVTGLLEGECEITLVSDNSYPGLPREAILYSSAATDETQTNWNGVLGYLRLRTKEQVFLNEVRAYPQGNCLTVKVEVCAAAPLEGTLSLSSEALKEPAVVDILVKKGTTEVVLGPLPLREDVRRWDEYEGILYELTASVSGGESKTVSFGVRDFGADDRGRFTLNGRVIFLRGEANCGVFPETGYEPMEEERWMEILHVYQSYGVNCVRFHSHCPPEAAFAAADKMGILMQPELSHWNPKDAFESEESISYYKKELLAVIRRLANHPSFVMLTLGNELQGTPKGRRRMSELLEAARKTDSTRRYASGSNNDYGSAGCDPDSDFYTAMRCAGEDLRGTFDLMGGYINHRYPDARANFDPVIARLRKSYANPVFGFEVGQFEILPDFGELGEFQGITGPANLALIGERVKERGLSGVWKKYVEATGELSRIGYREEVEAVLRTKGMSGLSLLGLQDFPGQGTALVGMLNSHLKPKPYPFAQPERFRAFFTGQLPLALLPKYAYENTETLRAQVKIANYGKRELAGVLHCELRGEDFCRRVSSKEPVSCPPGRLTRAMDLIFSLKEIERPARLELTLSVGEASNSYPLWVYPPQKPHCPPNVLETEHFDRSARQALREGKTVYLTPPSTKEALPSSIQAQFTTDFWSVGTFAGQEGGMGQLIDAGHPLFKDFPTEFHTNWQWWAMAGQRAVILPKRYDAIITEMDSYAYLRPMAQLLECRCGGGKLLFSTMGLQNLQQYPEARALLSSVYRYLSSDEFEPVQEMEAEVMEGLVN